MAWKLNIMQPRLWWSNLLVDLEVKTLTNLEWVPHNCKITVFCLWMCSNCFADWLWGQFADLMICFVFHGELSFISTCSDMCDVMEWAWEHWPRFDPPSLCFARHQFTLGVSEEQQDMIPPATKSLRQRRCGHCLLQVSRSHDSHIVWLSARRTLPLLVKSDFIWTLFTGHPMLYLLIL